MISNNHEDGQIVVSKEITPISPPKNSYGSNNTLAESSSSRKSTLSKIEEQMKSSVHPNNDKGKGVLVEDMSPDDEKEALGLDDNSESSRIEEINICDTCGDHGWAKEKLAVCSHCKIGAEHIYCMLVELKERPEEWFCYDCTEDGCGMRKGEETSSMKRKGESSFDFLKMEGRTSSQDQLDLLNTQSSVGVDLNIDLNAYPNIDLNVPSSSRKRKPEFIDFLKMSKQKSPQRQPDLLNTQSYRKIVGLDLNIDPNLDLNADLPIIDLNVDPNINLNVDPNIDLNMGPNLSLS